MSSSLKKLGSRIFIYLFAFILLFVLIVLFVLAFQTRMLRNNISNSFKEFSDEVNVVSEEAMSDNMDLFIENFVDIETKPFSYVVKDLKKDLNILCDSVALRYTNYDVDKTFYMDNIKKHDQRKDLNGKSEDDDKIKVF